ncbi:hypothetical protein [Priestia abyssalis]|uniref:hypothetical protein n=1 Tax=Priestia abyssalis TaxID=1221450 RepID=UPI0009956DB1|nr:hypothetical protein [Priestia abyssalis]
MDDQKYKKWITTFGLSLFALLGSVWLINYLVDPLWFYDHKLNINQIQKPFNERQQKTNRLTFQDETYDTLILGSSRMTYVNQYDFIGHDAFNYAVALGSIKEFPNMIEYAEQTNGKPFKTIVIGLDFFDTNLHLEGRPAPIDRYIEQVNEPFYRSKNLLSLDTLKVSIENIRHSSSGEQYPDRSYNRDNVVDAEKRELEKTKTRIYDVLSRYENINYEYDETYKQALEKVVAQNPNSTIIALTTPITAVRFKTELDSPVVRAGYERWLRESVDVFDNVYHFNDINSITTDLSNYFDTNHFYPHIGRLVAHRVIEYPDPDIPEDFGKLLNKQNIETYLTNTPLGRNLSIPSQK